MVNDMGGDHRRFDIIMVKKSPNRLGLQVRLSDNKESTPVFLGALVFPI
jgi:hypothetical protein